MSDLFTSENNKTLQDKLQELRNKISVKREAARQEFGDLIKAIDIQHVNVDGKLKEQLEAIKSSLTTAGVSKNNKDDTLSKKEDIDSAIAIEDVLMAIQMISTPQGGKVAISRKQLEEELAGIMFNKLSSQGKKMDSNWRNNVQASDLVKLLDSPKISPNITDAVRSSGGKDKFLSKAMDFAAELGDVMPSIKNLKQSVIGDATPPQAAPTSTPSAKQVGESATIR